jgi:hypothetical protein
MLVKVFKTAPSITYSAALVPTVHSKLPMAILADQDVLSVGGAVHEALGLAWLANVGMSSKSLDRLIDRGTGDKAHEHHAHDSKWLHDET